MVRSGRTTKKKLNVAVVYGGRSGEHEVSLLSAASVMKALDRGKYAVTPILIDKQGRWWHDPTGRPSGRKALKPDPRHPGWIRANDPIDVVFPLVHGTGGEDGCLQGLLEMAGVAYVGSGVLGSAVGMDKAVQKKILRQAGLPVVPWTDFRRDDWRRGRGRIVADIVRRLKLPVFVKPANLGSSVGITKAHDRKELMAGIRLALRYDTKVVVERAVPRPREIECSVLGGARPRASVPGEIVPSNEFYDYEAKYIDGRSRAFIPAPLPAAVSRRVRAMAGRVFSELEAFGLGRVDFLLTRGQRPRLFVNEINTIPGFTDISMYPKLWAASGLPYPRLLDQVIALARARTAVQDRLLRSYAPRRRGK